MFLDKLWRKNWGKNTTGMFPLRTPARTMFNDISTFRAFHLSWISGGHDKRAKVIIFSIVPRALFTRKSRKPLLLRIKERKKQKLINKFPRFEEKAEGYRRRRMEETNRDQKYRVESASRSEISVRVNEIRLRGGDVAAETAGFSSYLDGTMGHHRDVSRAVISWLSP